MAAMRWTEDAAGADGVDERSFEVEREGQTVPGVLWSPSTSYGPQPLVLMGHGGSGHKRNERMSMLGQMFVSHYGWSAAAIDHPCRHECRDAVSAATRRRQCLTCCWRGFLAASNCAHGTTWGEASKSLAEFVGGPAVVDGHRADPFWGGGLHARVSCRYELLFPLGIRHYCLGSQPR